MDSFQRRRVETRFALWLVVLLFVPGWLVVLSMAFIGPRPDPKWLASAVCLTFAIAGEYVAYRSWLALRNQPAPPGLTIATRSRAVFRSVLTAAVPFMIVYSIGWMINPDGEAIYQSVVIIAAAGVTGCVRGWLERRDQSSA